MRAAIYARVSSKPQLDGTSLDGQLRECREEAERQGWAVVGEFVDRGVSGERYAIGERPEGARLVSLCQAGGADLVLVRDQDRLGRDTIETLLALRDLGEVGVRVWIVSKRVEAGHDDTMTGMQAVFAAKENQDRKERALRGLIARAEDGYWTGGPTPYGYRAVPTEAIRRGKPLTKLAPDPDEAAVVRLASTLIVDDGLGTMLAARRLDEMGIRPRYAGTDRGGDRWCYKSLRHSLSLEVLKGEYHYRTQGFRSVPPADVTIEVEPILPRERWEKLQGALGASATGSRSKQRVFPLSGRLVGPEGTFHGVQRQGTAPRRNPRPGKASVSPYYRCPGARRMLADPVERRVWTEVCDYLADEQRVWRDIQAALDRAASAGATPIEAKRLAREIERKDRAIDTLVSDYAQAGIPADRLRTAMEGLEAEKSALVARKGVLDERRATAELARDRAEALRLAYERIGRLRDATLERQRSEYRKLDVRVEVTGWHDCDRCGARGKLRASELTPWERQHCRKQGLLTATGVVCPNCRGARHVPELRITGDHCQALEEAAHPAEQPHHRLRPAVRRFPVPFELAAVA